MTRQQDLTILSYRLVALLIPALESASTVLSPDRYIRLQRLLSNLPTETPLGHLKWVLCPIFATNAQEQRTFFTIFEEIYPTLDILSEQENQPLIEKPEKPALPEVHTEAPKKDSPAKAEPNPININPTVRQRRPLVVELDECTAPPFSWNIIPEQAQGRSEITIGEEFDQTLLRLRRREVAESRSLDLKASIKATIQGGGFPVIEFRHLTRPPEYLLLVERSSYNDHRAGLFDYLYQTLRNNQVFVERFFYDGDIRICRNEKYPSGLKLPELREKFANARLVILGTGVKLISPNTGKLASWAIPLTTWNVRAMLTPVPRTQWTRRENILEKTFTLLPASIKSLQFIADTPDSLGMRYTAMPDYIKRLAEVEPISIDEGHLLYNLRQHFDRPLLCWIASCAIYPALHYDLTLGLGRLLSDFFNQNLLTATNLLSLSRLPWFTQGRIPASSRNELLEYLDARHPEPKQQVLLYLQGLMENNPPPRESVAWAEHQINLSLLKSKTQEVPDTETLEELRAVVKRLDRDVMVGDFVLPEAWEKILEQLGSNFEEVVFEKPKSSITVLILTPLPIEYEAVVKNLTGDRRSIIIEAAAYELGEFVGKHHIYQVIIREPGIKNVDIRLATEKAIHHFKPQIVLLIGIAGGIKDVQVGDVVIASNVYGYESGKEGRDGFLEGPSIKPFSSELLAQSNILCSNEEWKKRTFDGAHKSNVFISPIVSGDKVEAGVSNPTFERIKPYYNDALVMSFEDIGIATVLQYHPLLHGITIRGISDVIESKSSENIRRNWQTISAERAAAVGFELLYQINANDWPKDIKQNDPYIIEEKQIPERYILVEHFTNSRCSLCASRNPAFYNTLSGYSKDVYHIAYHPPIPYNNCAFYLNNPIENKSRSDYYGISGTPMLALNGKLLLAGSSLLKENTLKSSLDAKSPVSIEISETKRNERFEVEVTIKVLNEVGSGIYLLMVALVERTVNRTTPNGEKVHHNVFRKMLAGVDGQRVQIEKTETFLFSTTIDKSWNIEEIHAIAWVQNVETKEVLNCVGSVRGIKSIEKKSKSRKIKELIPIQIFIAYSQKDRVFLDALRSHAMPLLRKGNVTVWFDGEIRPGETWDEVIKSNLHTADIILMLLSANALASDYFYEQEVKDAIERHKAGTARVVPVVLSACLWQKTPLAEIQGLPHGMKPIISYGNMDEAWNEVVEGLWEMVEEIEQKTAEKPDSKAPELPKPVQTSSKTATAAEEHAWEFTTDTNTRAAYQEYLYRFPQGFYSDKAHDFLVAIVADDNAWEFANVAGTNQAIQKYIKKYPKGLHTEAARKLIDPFYELMVPIKGGTFEMGDILGDDYSNKLLIHKVYLDDFMMCKYPVTQGHWKSIMGNEDNPSYFRGDDLLPVELVSWDMAQMFIEVLNKKTNRKYRLPTEAEWEYAARECGKKVRFGNGKDIASPAEINFDSQKDFRQSYSIPGIFRAKTSRVNLFKPNALGLCDMSGNIWEWCSDNFAEDYFQTCKRQGIVQNPQGPSKGSYRLARGGGWYNVARACTSTCRNYGRPDYRSNDLGFRLALSL